MTVSSFKLSHAVEPLSATVEECVVIPGYFYCSGPIDLASERTSNRISGTCCE